jgi:hypothetical protein
MKLGKLLLRVLTFGGWPILALPVFLLWLGIMCNEAAIYANHIQMPFMYPGDACTPDKGDLVHVCMTHASHLKFLGDWIISDSGAASIGDFLQNIASDVVWDCRIAWLGALVVAVRCGKFWLGD